MFFKGSPSRPQLPSWTYSLIPPPAIGEAIVAVSQQRVNGWVPTLLGTSLSCWPFRRQFSISYLWSEASVDVPLRRQLSSCLPTESGIPELDLFVTCRVSIARFSSSRSGCSVDSMGQVVGICLSTNSVEAASTSQVGSLKSVSNASSGSTSALPAVACNTS